jgi:hypothetical protein
MAPKKTTRIEVGASVQLAGTSFTGTVTSIDGDVAEVKWDDEAAKLPVRSTVAALEPKKRK